MRTVLEGWIMRQSRTKDARWLCRPLIGVVLVIACLLMGWESTTSAAVTPRRFASVEEAVNALVGALRTGDQKAMLADLRR